jgi:uncharacterized protein
VKPSLTRRQFLKSGPVAAAAAAVGAGGYSFAVEPYRLVRKSYDLVSPKWPSSYPPLRIAVASDFHVGCPSIDLRKTAEIVARLNARKPDVILLIGDYLIRGVVGGHYVPPAPIAKAFSALRAPLGVFSVLGNHDWWMDGPGMWTALEDAGITVLENDAVAVKHAGKTVWIAGLADDTTRHPDIAKTLTKTGGDHGSPVIMMSHDPAPFLEMTGRPVVTLAGHTHGGQVAIPFIGPLMIPGRSPLRYAYGHITEGDRDMIVNKGIGTSGLPVRFDRVPEIVTVTIRPAVTDT